MMKNYEKRASTQMNDKTTKKILRENMRKMKWLVTFFICEKGHNWLWNGTYILCFFLKKITTSGKIFHDRWSQHISPLLTGWLRISGENLNKKMFKKMRASSQVSERAGGESRVADTGSLSSPADILCHSILTSTFSASFRLNFTVFYSNLPLSTLLYYALLHTSLLY